LSEISTWHPSENRSPGLFPEDPVLAVLPWVVDEGPEVEPVTNARRGNPARTRAIIVAVGGVLLVAVAGWRVTDSALFHMRSLQVKGARHLGAQEVARLGGLGSGTNVLWLRPGRVADGIRRNPWVLSVRVSRTLPSTINIQVVERTPVAEVAGSSPVLVAADGVVLGPAGPRADLPLIYLAGPPPVTGARLPASLPALEALQALPRGLRRMITQAVADPATGLTLTLRDGGRVFYGDASDAAAKGAALEGVLSWARAHGVTPGTVDVRVPEAPALVPGVGSASAALAAGA
jgi:cell division protein FtsQ